MNVAKILSAECRPTESDFYRCFSLFGIIFPFSPVPDVSMNYSSDVSMNIIVKKLLSEKKENDTHERARKRRDWLNTSHKV